MSSSTAACRPAESSSRGRLLAQRPQAYLALAVARDHPGLLHVRGEVGHTQQGPFRSEGLLQNLGVAQAVLQRQADTVGADEVAHRVDGGLGVEPLGEDDKEAELSTQFGSAGRLRGRMLHTKIRMERDTAAVERLQSPRVGVEKDNLGAGHQQAGAEELSHSTGPDDRCPHFVPPKLADDDSAGQTRPARSELADVQFGGKALVMVSPL
jgi:hypothetical protein